MSILPLFGGSNRMGGWRAFIALGLELTLISFTGDLS
jgi:hypothetical protein